jgi:hypothetical protein
MTTAELVKQEAGAGTALEAQEAASQIKAALASGRKALWELAEALYAFDEMKGWQQLDYATLSDWLADTEGTITRSTYYRLVRTWRKVVVELEVDADRVSLLDQSKVAIVADKIGGEETTVDDALADVEALGAQDLREKYKPSRPKPTPAGEAEEPASAEPEAEVDASASEPVEASTTPRRDALRGRLELLAAATSGLVAQESEGAPASDLKGKLISLEGAIAEARSAAGGAVDEEGA